MATFYAVVAMTTTRDCLTNFRADHNPDCANLEELAYSELESGANSDYASCEIIYKATSLKKLDKLLVRDLPSA